MGNHPVVVWIGIVAGLATILTFLLQFDVIQLPGRPTAPASSSSATGPSDTCEEPSISLTPGRGRSGDSVTIKGSGFPAGQVVNFNYHTERMAPARVGADGSFQTTVSIPGLMDPFAPVQVHVTAITDSPVCHADAVFALAA